MLVTLAATGCASITNPVANGVPVRLVPDELLAKPKEELELIPMHWLTKPRPEVYRLGPGDVLGVFIETVVGDVEEVPPVYYPPSGDQPPAIGYPMVVREDGTVSLPFIEPLNVEGMTIQEAETAIIRAYTGADQQEILNAEANRIIVTLARQRQVRVSVVREDTPGRRTDFIPGYGVGLFSRSAQLIDTRDQGSGHVVDMPETEADVFNVLARTGGLPGPNAANEVIIFRGFKGPASAEELQRMSQDGQFPEDGDSSEERIVRIPLRWPPGEPPPFGPEDISLQDGDIVLIPALEAQVYYTGGLLPAREVPLPRDYDISAVEAVLRVGGPLINGGFNANNFTGGLVTAGLGNPSPSLLTVIRRTPNGQQIPIRVDLHRAVRDSRENILIQAGDILVLQETPAEAVSRYFSQIFNFNGVVRVFEGGSAVGNAAVSVP